MPVTGGRRALLLIALVGTAALAAGGAAPAPPEPPQSRGLLDPGLDMRFERTLPVEKPLRLEVTTGMGNIVVRTGGEDEVRVVGRITVPRGVLLTGLSTEALRGLLEAPPIEQKGRRVRVGRIKDRDLGARLAISYEIVVPRDTELRSATGLGDHIVEGLRRVRASAGTGNLLVRDIAGEVRLLTGQGDVDLRGIRGPVRANSRGGHIRAVGTPDSTWRIGTELGDVSVRVPRGARFELHARSAVGGIRVEHPVELAGPALPGEMHGKVGGGGPRLQLETRLGSIRIE